MDEKGTMSRESIRNHRGDVPPGISGDRVWRRWYPKHMRSRRRPPPAPAVSDPASRVAAIPARGRGTGGGCRFNGPLLRVPLTSAGAEGIVVRTDSSVRRDRELSGNCVGTV
jgi:hypothetical protein